MLLPASALLGFGKPARTQGAYTPVTTTSTGNYLDKMGPGKHLERELFSNNTFFEE
jgi:hypothetical protein